MYPEAIKYAGVTTENDLFRIVLLDIEEHASSGMNYGVVNKVTERVDFRSPNLVQALGAFHAFTNSMGPYTELPEAGTTIN